jgi:hypothetical protein
MGEYEGAARFFSPPGRRWPEGSDEGAALPNISTLAPSSRCRDLLPGRGEVTGGVLPFPDKLSGDIL